MQTFIKPLTELAEFTEIRDRMRRGRGICALTGCIDAQKAHMVHGLSDGAKIVVVVTENDLTAKAAHEDLRFFEPDALLYPAKDLLFYQADIASNLLDTMRMRVFRSMAEAERTVVVLPVAALMDQVSARESFLDGCISFDREDETDLDWIKETLVEIGYERCAEVTLPGHFAVRGDIVDIWSLTEEHPFRIELFGDEIDSIRSFDAESQRSIEELSHILIYPANDHIGRLGTFLDWIPVSAGKDASAVSSAIFLDEPMHILDAARAVETEFRESMKNRIAQGSYAKGDHIPEIKSADEIVAALDRRCCVALSMLDTGKGTWNITASCGATVQGVGSYNGSFEMLSGDLLKYKKKGYRIVVLSGSHTRAKRLAQDLRSLDVPAFYTEDGDLELQPGQIAVEYGHVRRGFEYPLIRFAIISEGDIFGARQKKKKKRTRYSGEKIASFAELHVGDYVVHENRGLCIYKGIEQVKVDDVLKDYIKLEYRDGNLYILATQLDVLQKYGGAEGKAPKLNRLNGQEWDKTRAKVKSSVKNIARELVELYAARESADGFVYSQDTEWQKEFEELFPFEETEDQLAAIEDTKHDMESRKIMDRLICGDVGYGKTEIALRAAFKAIQDGKQVACLVPTTILAQQHYNTFLQRMKDFPVRVDLLCRFRTSAEIKASIRDLRKGLVDIVIGTHRLLSKDVVFKDLGLLIIDEEQRFGVTHKEKIKNLRKDVDVLTLTATPIPRTLHMSLVGIRDMSILTEPPQDRVPIQTYVMEYDPEMVREAICRELARNGQVYYVYNRVRDIADMATRIQNLVPEAAVAYADGQMNKRELEDIMVDFINGEIDVLVTTTIIETGLDISNANTMIIHDADRMGLSQLYQLRGRVGRSARTAYAFLMYRRDKQLKEVAEKRVAAIRGFTGLGSGFKIAMRDLEIRGAGNLLGSEQHGHMDLVGYDLYCKLLTEAVREAKGIPAREEFETVVDIVIDAFIPDTYIANEFTKLDFYKKIAAIENDRDYEDMSDELMDRFGTLPLPVQNLLSIADLKASAHAASITEIKERPREVVLSVLPEPTFDRAAVPGIIGSFGGMFGVRTYAQGTQFVYKGERGTRQMIANLKRFTTELARTCESGYNEH